MEDIAPELLKKIQTDFNKIVKQDKVLANLISKVKNGIATYDEANEYAIQIGTALAKAFSNNLSADILPDGKMYYNIANRIVSPCLKNNYNLVSEVCYQVQESLNKNANIGIKALRPELNEQKILGFINRLSNTENYDEISWILNEPVINFSQSAVDDAIKTNMELHGKTGLQPKIVRTSSFSCCKWCSDVAGIYNYPNVPKNVFRRHERCRCIVTYDPADERKEVQDVWRKDWKSYEESDKIRAEQLERKLALENGLAKKISEYPKPLQSFTPETLKKALENEGYEIKPLGRGNYKGIAFEDGGGYRTSYGGDGYLQYHPQDRSHHGGAYYKTSNGKDGIHKYNLKGEEIDESGDVIKE